MMHDKKKHSRSLGVKAGYALLTAILAINLFAILALKARTTWETILQRDLEEELIFRARQYVIAIELYMKKNPNVAPKNLDILFEKHFLRKRYLDPMTEDGKWNLVMQGGATTGKKKALLIVPEDQVEEYITKARIIGVCSMSCMEGFKIYRKKKKYCEWAIYIGEDPTKEMPELKFVNQPEGEEKPKASDSGDDDDEDDEETDDDRVAGSADEHGKR